MNNVRVLRDHIYIFASFFKGSTYEEEKAADVSTKSFSHSGTGNTRTRKVGAKTCDPCSSGDIRTCGPSNLLPRPKTELAQIDLYAR